METEETAWTKADLQKLLATMKNSIPKHMKMNCYVEGMKSLDWNKVAFRPFSPEACKQKWTKMLEKMRKIRTLTELIAEAEDVIAKPVCNRKGEKCTEDEEDLPPRPIHSGYMLFCKEQLTSMKGNSRKTTLDVCSKRWGELSETERKKYRKNCTELKKQYKIKLDKYLERFDKQKRKQICRDKGIKIPKKYKSGESTDDEEGLPPRPPNTGYMLFCKEQLIRKRRRGISSNIILDVCGKRWRKLSETEKEKYRTNCTELKKQYMIKLNEHLERFDEEEREQICREKGIKIPKEHKSGESTDNEEGLPPKPIPSGYMLFCKEQLTSMKGISMKINFDVCGKRWQELSETEKEKYRTDCIELKKQYMIKLDEYLERFDIEEQEKIRSERVIKIPKKYKQPEIKHVERLPGEPKKPSLSGNVIFCQHQMELLKEEIPNGQKRFAQANRMWKDLSTQEKEHYNGKVVEKMEKYYAELQTWLNTLTVAEQKKYLTSNPIKRQYLEVKKSSVFVKEPILCQPSDSEDDDIEFSEEENCWVYDEEEEEEEEDEEDAMFEM